MYDIRNQTSTWANETFGQGIIKLKELDTDLFQKVLNCFNSIKISDKLVNGYACENLPKTEEGNTGIKITYSDVFHELLERDDFTPTNYLVRLIELFSQYNCDPSKLNGFIARGLRTLTSFLREPDFAFFIREYLKDFDPNVRTNLNPRQDAGDHTDVLLKYKDNEYRIWLFQFSSRGLPHDIDRITGKRGALPNGTHVLCPLKTELAIEYDKKLNKKNSIILKINKWENELNTCSLRAEARRNALIQKIEKYKDTLVDINNELDPLYKSCSDELDILNGWYFYSATHIQRIASLIKSSAVALAYSDVVTILESPEKFLSKTKIFYKD